MNETYETTESHYGFAVFLVIVLVIGVVACAYFADSITGNLATKAQADGVIARETTLQMQSYYAFLATVALMSQQAQQAADDMPAWFLPLFLLFLIADGLLGYLVWLKRARG